MKVKYRQNKGLLGLFIWLIAVDAHVNREEDFVVVCKVTYFMMRCLVLFASNPNE